MTLLRIGCVIWVGDFPLLKCGFSLWFMLFILFIVLIFIALITVFYRIRLFVVSLTTTGWRVCVGGLGEVSLDILGWAIMSGWRLISLVFLLFGFIERVMFLSKCLVVMGLLVYTSWYKIVYQFLFYRYPSDISSIRWLYRWISCSNHFKDCFWLCLVLLTELVSVISVSIFSLNWRLYSEATSPRFWWMLYIMYSFKML